MTASILESNQVSAGKSKTRLRFKMAAYLTDDVVYISFLSLGLTRFCFAEVFTDEGQLLP